MLDNGVIVKKRVIWMMVSALFASSGDALTAKKQEPEKMGSKKACKLRYTKYTKPFYEYGLIYGSKFDPLMECLQKIKNERVTKGTWNGLIKSTERFDFPDESSIPIGKYVMKLRASVEHLAPWQIEQLNELGLSANARRFKPFSNKAYEDYVKRENEKKERELLYRPPFLNFIPLVIVQNPFCEYMRNIYPFQNKRLDIIEEDSQE